MATLSFNKDNRIDDFTFILVRKDNYNIGAIQAKDVNFNHNFNGPDELSLKVYKDLDPKFNKYWDRLNDYNDLYVPELGTDGYFEIEVTLNEDSEGVYKTVTGTSRCESELSHTKIYTYEINSDDEMIYDEKWDESNVTRLYRDPSQDEAEVESIQAILNGMSPSDSNYKNIKRNLEAAKQNLYNTKHRSIMHRLLDKLPNYSIDHVDQTLVELTDWYQFSWDDESIYDIMTGDLADNYHVLFKFDSKNRKISLYDLYTVCMNNDCNYRVQMQEDRNITTRYRGDFHHVCPKCGSKNVTEGYGKFTKIIVSKDNLMNSAQVSSNKDNLINCFKVKGGDEDFDAAVVNQNPNGSDYFYQFSDENMAEMPPELVQKIQDYQNEYNLWYQGNTASGKGIYNFTSNEVTQLNNLVTFCKNTFNEKITQDFIPLKTRYVGYQSLASQYYSLLDLESFYEASMVPDLDSSDMTIDEALALMIASKLGPLSTNYPKTVSLASVESALIQSAKCLINTALFTVEVVNSGSESSYTAPSANTGNGTWRGKLRLKQIEYINTVDETEYTRTTGQLTITVNNDMNNYVSQRVKAMTQRKDTSLMSLMSILDEELEEVKQANGGSASRRNSLKTQFNNKLKEYSLGVLTDIIRPCYVDVLAIIEQNSDKINSIYWNFYKDHLTAIDNEIKNKTANLATITSILKKVETYRQQTKDALNFANYLGDDLYKVFCNYRREDTYNNDNYISTDLDNSTIMRRAGELIDAAQKELYKASHLQFDVTGNLNNLLALPEFAPIKDDFEVGNWIKMSVDDVLYDLRLLSYSINFGELQSINIDFSTVEKIWSGASDIQSVLQSAGSIAGSYSIVQNKVKENDKSTKLVNNWVSDGLSATMTKFANDPIAQEIVYDSTGLYARGYDDTTGEYLPQQLKIVKNGLYITDDNWDSINTGVGAFTYVDENGNVQDAYGIIANTVVGKLVLGENLVIYNEGGTFKVNEDGLTLKDDNGTKVFYADTNGNLVITGKITAGANSKIGPWTVTDTSIYKGNATMGTAGQGNMYFGNDGLSVSNTFKVSNTGKLTATGADINGAITAGSGSIGGFYITSTANNGTTANGGHIYTTSLYRHSADDDYEYEVGMKGDGNTSSTTTSGNLAFYIKRIAKGAAWTSANATTMFHVTHSGALYAINADIKGSIKATSGQIGVGSNKINIGTNTTHSSIYYGMSSLGNTTNDGFYIGTDGIALGKGAFKVTSSGALTATSATIQGKVTATELIAKTKGTIGPWTLTSTSLYTGSSTIGGSGVYLGNDGISITDKFVVSDAGTVNAGTVYIKKGHFYLTNANGDTDASQHIQMSEEFIYTGDNSTDRTTIMPDGIYWQGGKYIGIATVNGSPTSWWKATAYKAIGYSYLTTIHQSGATTYAEPIIRVRGYDNVFRTPVGSSSTATNYCFGLGARSGNALYVSGAWGESGGNDTCHITMSSSDIRLKENIQDCTIEALPVIKSIQMKSFDWKDNREFKHQPIGMIADEVEKLDPRLASGGGYEENGSMNIKTIETFYLMGYLVKGMQEQQQEIESLKQTIKELNGGKNYED